MSRLFPWGSTPRLAEVEAALPGDTAGALEAAVAAAARHARRLEDECLLLYAGTNVPSPLVASLHAAALAAQPSMGYPGDKYQAGLEPLDEVEVAAAGAVARLMGARFAELRPTSATLANLAVYTALARPGDTIAVLPDWAGGHLSHHAIGAAGVRGLRVAPLPYDAEALDVDVAALPGFLAREAPVLVVVGASLMLFPHRLREIAGAVHASGARLLYDASHVAGLIAEGRFQAPLAEGADLMTFSTYKSFGGPPGGAIVSDDEALAERVANAVYPGLTANYDVSRLPALTAAVLEHERADGAYADQCMANAAALARALDAAGLPVLGAARGFTVSHHVAVDARPFGGGKHAALALAEHGLLLSEIGIPGDGLGARPAVGERVGASGGRAPLGDPAGGLRFGTQAITRQGFIEDDMEAIAGAVADVLLRDGAPDVAAIRRRHTGLRFCLSDSASARAAAAAGDGAARA